jgi:hypothetical protein
MQLPVGLAYMHFVCVVCVCVSCGVSVLPWGCGARAYAILVGVAALHLRSIHDVDQFDRALGQAKATEQLAGTLEPVPGARTTRTYHKTSTHL